MIFQFQDQLFRGTLKNFYFAAEITFSEILIDDSNFRKTSSPTPFFYEFLKSSRESLTQSLSMEAASKRHVTMHSNLQKLLPSRHLPARS